MTSRDEEAAEGEEWDGAAWVNVDRYGHWEPSPAERSRAFILLGTLLGLLLLAAAFASLGSEGDGDGGITATSVSTTTVAPTTTATTRPAPSSIDGTAPPDDCVDDDRDALPLRDRDEAPVRVLNGVGTRGLAGDTSDRLAARGYVAEPGDAPQRTGITTLTYVAGYCAEAVRLAEDLGLDALSVQAIDRPIDGETTEAGALRLEIVLGGDHFGDEP